MTQTSKLKITFDYYEDGKAQAKMPFSRLTQIIYDALFRGLNVEFLGGKEPKADGLKLIQLTIDSEDGNNINEESSAKVKRALKDYFEVHGIPSNSDEVQDSSIDFLIETFGEEFTEAAAEFENESAPKL